MPESIIKPDPNSALTQLQCALREQQLILDNAGVGIVFVKRRLVIRCNQRFAQMFGYAQVDEIVGGAHLSLYPDQSVFDTLEEAALPVMTKGQVYRTELQLIRHHGELFWAHLTGQLVNPADSDEGSIWIVDDVTEQRSAMARLESVLAEQSLILDNAMVGIVFLRDRIVTRCNRSCEVMLGYEPGELNGTSTRQWYLTEQDWNEAAHSCYAPFEKGQAFDGEMVLRKKDGTPAHCWVRAKAIDFNEPSKGSIWIGMDS